MVQWLVEEVLMERVFTRRGKQAEYQQAHDHAHEQVQKQLAEASGGVR